jgi:glutamate dehydrogenase
VGIGDMSGDVFGNGMLLSRHIRLVAAFDHRHVFVDPDPDAVRSFAERERLFGLPRSSWDDYDRGVVSAGGGVWPRSAKSVPVGAEVRAALGIDEGVVALSPPELIGAILRAPVDLLWNGGVGTYVKASGESHAEAGDKANDAVRVDGRELRARVVGEGGNLGFTQRGRIEFARGGGRINTDAIDNSAGVDCSDHEVNIKVLLDRLVAAGALDRAARDALLAEMTDEVADLVLEDNRSQNAVLAISRADAAQHVDVHAQMVADLEARRGLDRRIEVLPDASGFAALRTGGEGLSGPELAVLLAHTKLDLKAAILQTDLPDLPEVEGHLTSYFPRALGERHPAAVAQHPLRREIVITSLVNHVIDRGGLTSVFELQDAHHVPAAEVLRAFLITSQVFDLPDLWVEIDRLPSTAPAAAVDEIVRETQLFLVQAARRLLTRRSLPLLVADEIDELHPVRALRSDVPELLTGHEAAAVTARIEVLCESGVPRLLAQRVAGLRPALGLFDIIEMAERVPDVPLTDMARIYYTLSERLS